MINQLIIVTVLFTQTRGEWRHCDLRKHGLRAVPTNIPSRTQSLDLSENLLKTIHNDSFVNLNALTSLDLSGNQLEKLEPLAFRGLSRLSTLRLNNNNLLLTYEVYPVAVFRPLTNLQLLTLGKNIRGRNSQLGKYPEKIFSGLGSLKELSIDGLRNVAFGSGFLRLSLLRSLRLTDDAQQATLSARTFAVFANMSIETLLIECLEMKPGTLKHFPFLTTLAMSTGGLRRAFSALVDLRWWNLTSLSIVSSNRNRGGRLDAKNIVVTSDMTAHLATMCVKRLDLSDNKLIKINTDVLLGFKRPECLETLVMKDNLLGFVFSMYDFWGIFSFTNLKYLDIDGGNEVNRWNRGSIWTRRKMVTEGSSGSMKTETIRVRLPPSLEVIRVRNFGGENDKIPNIVFVNNENLRVLDLGYDGIQDCAFRVSGLHNLTQLTISGFDCAGLSPNVFESFPSLKILSARNCKLNIGFQNDPNGMAFRPVKQLQQLDLSDNDLTTLHTDLFKPLVRLETLILSNNKLRQIPEAVLQIQSLTELDMAFNVISSLSSEAIHILSSLPMSGHGKTLSLSLEHNPLLCTCNTLSFIHWILETSVNITDDDSLSCSLGNGTITNIWSYKSQIKNMDVSCVSKFWLTFSVVGSCLVTVSVVLGMFGYRYRWNIKYWVLTKCRRGPVYEEIEMEQFQFDAFVAYNYHNYQWACIVLRNVLETENNYTLCLHDRDFPVGVSIQQNIVDAVNNSRKVILVINRAFLTSDWCEFEIQMAGMRMVRDGRENAIIVIMMEEIAVAEMPRSLLNLWKHITFLLWENDLSGESVFWERLLEVMARP